MSMGELPSCCSDSKIEIRTRRPACRLAVVAMLFGLAACNPVETWRDWTGASRDDPDPATTPNTRNLAAGEAADYPNLATVPPPPVRAMTAAERENLTQSLIADRANARHTDEQLRAGFPAGVAAPPPPPGSQPDNAQPEPVAAAPPNVASAPETVREKPPPAAASRAARSGVRMPPAPGQGARKQGEPPEPGPMESSLEVPQARAAPRPEQIQPAPPPQLPPTPRVAKAAPLPGGLAAGGALAPSRPAEETGAAGPEAAPPPPELPPPVRSAAAGPGKAAQKPSGAAGKPVAEVEFGADSTSLTDNDRRTLETVVPLYQQNPGKVRIVGYAGAASGAVEQLNGYRIALDRAQAVAAALTKAGIPSDKIQVEAAPTGDKPGDSRAEVLLEH